MLTDVLLKKLYEKRNEIDAAIRVIESFAHSENRTLSEKRVRIIKHLKKEKKRNPSSRKLHWTQRPENKARLRALRLKSNRERAEREKNG